MKGGEETSSFSDMVCMTLKNESVGTCVAVRFSCTQRAIRFLKAFFLWPAHTKIVNNDRDLVLKIVLNVKE